VDEMSRASKLSPRARHVLWVGATACALAACSAGAGRMPGQPSATGAGDTTGGAGSGVNPDQTGAAGTTIVIMQPTGAAGAGIIVTPTPAMCGSGLPGTFVAICSGCHTTNGAANSRYPDLYAYKGTASDMVKKVRTGGNGMAAYPAALISDADVATVFAYFTTSMRTGLDGISLQGVTPLFTAADAVNPPVIFKRDDGALITRGAGRVRGRHEGPLDTNMPFMEFVEDYFLARTYGWIVEDFTPLGQSHIRVTYLPISMPTGGTNFRAWKNYGNGDVFTNNEGMTSDVPLPSIMVGGQEMTANYQTKLAPYARIQQQETMANGRTNGPIKPGDLFEFEFGIFNDHAAIQPPGSRTNYYTDTYRYQVGKGGVTSNNPDTYTGGKGILGPVPLAQLGGDTTNVWPYFMQETQFGQMALNVQHENVQHLVMGRRLFHTDFTTGAHSEQPNLVFMEQIGKAGPMGQSTSCETCHVGNGPGELLKAGLDTKSSMAIKLYNAGKLGVQLQPQEGDAAVMGTTTKVVKLADGTSVTLSKPTIAIMTKDGTSPAFSARIARKVIGMGLLEAIDERTILSRADPLDCDKNGISGRPSFVKDPTTGALRLGRFGWKAEKVSVEHQIAEALSEDMGVGTTMFPENGKAELSDDDLSHLVTYMRLVSVPGQRNFGDAQVAGGEQIFKTIGCESCHATDVVTGANHPFAELRNQAVKPFSDLLLHDMGPDLADSSGVPDAAGVAGAPPSASEWRTPPLWGTGLIGTVNGHTGLLHDGRAANVLEAILWHGGEAAPVELAVTQLSAADRAALVAFVSSL
jgi:CxxC motif-containing protein (DUF1111 family)/cytochrome c553